VSEKTRATEDLLGQLHAAVAKDLLNKVKSGEASAQELNAAIKFLKDNGIELLSEPGDDLDKLANSLPDFREDDAHTYN
jgi:hypothetical protein